jgi:hypothetical protein
LLVTSRSYYSWRRYGSSLPLMSNVQRTKKEKNVLKRKECKLGLRGK